MEWKIVTEFAPGIGTGPGNLPFLCPGCWAEEVGQEVPTGPRLERWFKLALEVLKQQGHEHTELSAEELAKDYEKEPWHDS